MARTFTTFQGKRVTPYMAYCLKRFDQWLTKHYKLNIVCRDAIRTEAQQEAIFRARYVTAGNVNGRKVYDIRWWNGQWWYRVSSAGTVAPPNSPQANHQIQGTAAAFDIADTGRDAGITARYSTRGQAFREAIKPGGELGDLGVEAEGDNFGEGWHFKVKNIDRAVPSSTPATASVGKPTVRKPVPADMLKWDWTGIQRMLKSDFGYTGRIDNDPGAGTKMAMRRFLNAKGYSKRACGYKLKIANLFTSNDVKSIQQWLNETGRNAGHVDGIPGSGTHAAWNKAEAANDKVYARVK